MSNNKSDYLLNLNISVIKDELSTKELDIDFLNLYLGNNVYFSSTLLMWLKNYLKFITISFEDSDQEIKLSPDKLSLDEFDERLIKSDEFGFEAFELLKELFLPYMGEIVFKIWYFLIRFVAPVLVFVVLVREIA